MRVDEIRSTVAAAAARVAEIRTGAEAVLADPDSTPSQRAAAAFHLELAGPLERQADQLLAKAAELAALCASSRPRLTLLRGGLAS